jgi:hypothetical protein
MVFGPLTIKASLNLKPKSAKQFGIQTQQQTKYKLQLLINLYITAIDLILYNSFRLKDSLLFFRKNIASGDTI